MWMLPLYLHVNQKSIDDDDDDDADNSHERSSFMKNNKENLDCPFCYNFAQHFKA